VERAAGYSGTPLPRKLGIREGARIALLHAPEGFDDLLAPLPPAVTVLRQARAPLDLVVVFATARAGLDATLRRLMARIDPAGGIWVAWPKRASGRQTDLTEDVLREVALPLGLVDTKVCAIDATWSGLRLVIRRELRPAARG
jgi:hypothetical protein